MGESRKKIKIVEVYLGEKAEAEKEIEDLVNQGWRIIAAGGGTGGFSTSGFVILQYG